jgi:hypothetical protein
VSSAAPFQRRTLASSSISKIESGEASMTASRRSTVSSSVRFRIATIPAATTRVAAARSHCIGVGATPCPSLSARG